MTTTIMALDHHKLHSEIGLADPGETDPAWEIAAILTNEDRIYLDGTDGTRMIRELDLLLDDPNVVSVVLSLWVQA